MVRRIDTAAVDPDAFGFKAKALFQAACPGQPDFSAGADDAVPGQSFGVLKRPHDLPGTAGEAGCFRHLTVGGYSAARNPPDDCAHLLEHSSSGSPLDAKVWRESVGVEPTSGCNNRSAALKAVPTTG